MALHQYPWAPKDLSRGCPYISSGCPQYLVAVHACMWSPKDFVAVRIIMWVPMKPSCVGAQYCRGHPLCSVVAQSVAVVGWPCALCVAVHVRLGMDVSGWPSCLCRDCPPMCVTDHDLRGHTQMWAHVITWPLAYLGPRIIRPHVTPPHGGHMDVGHTRNCGRELCAPRYKS